MSDYYLPSLQQGICCWKACPSHRRFHKKVEFRAAPHSCAFSTNFPPPADSSLDYQAHSCSTSPLLYSPRPPILLQLLFPSPSGDFLIYSVPPVSTWREGRLSNDEPNIYKILRSFQALFLGYLLRTLMLHVCLFLHLSSIPVLLLFSYPRWRKKLKKKKKRPSPYSLEFIEHLLHGRCCGKCFRNIIPIHPHK